MNSFENAIATLRVKQLAAKQEDEALSLLLREALRMRKALQFYAARDNYIDGVPMLAQLGELVDPDEGYTARRALKLDDYHSGTPVLKSTIEEGNMKAEESLS